MTDQSREAVMQILEEQTADDGSLALIAAMAGGALDADEAFERTLRELKMFIQGISDARQH
ncbi:MAG TPA: hypothetical protein VF553_07050 [Pyrinomonadaceae bacterium]